MYPRHCNPALFDKDLTGKIIVITGANSGIGYETMKQLAKQGATVVIACRDDYKAKMAIKRAEESVGRELDIEPVSMDLADLRSVESAAEFILSHFKRVDVLVNNAGVMGCDYRLSKQGVEWHFAVNHLGHFHLTNALIPLLKKSDDARIICVSSSVHDCPIGENRSVAIDFDDVNYIEKPYKRWEAYSQSKLANVLHAKALASRYEADGITAVSVHPGWVLSQLSTTAVGQVATWCMNTLLAPLLKLMGAVSCVDGAQTSLHCILDSNVPRHNGEFYSSGSGVRYYRAHERYGGWPRQSPNPHVYEKDYDERLWALSERLIQHSPASAE